jgi:hypothetical protein
MKEKKGIKTGIFSLYQYHEQVMGDVATMVFKNHGNRIALMLYKNNLWQHGMYPNIAVHQLRNVYINCNAAKHISIRLR